MTEEYNSLRNSLVPKLLETFQANKHHDLPQKVFEIGEVVEITNKGDVKTDTDMSFSAGIIGPNAGFTEIKSVLDAIMRNLGIDVKLKAIKDGRFIDGRAAEIRRADKIVGVIGEINPEVLMNFSLENPVAVLEVEIDKVM
jgi:phenylalanyl-tRNA synthetase beta chain